MQAADGHDQAVLAVRHMVRNVAVLV